MNLHVFRLPFLAALALPGFARAHDADSQSGPLGKVAFPTTCDAKVQPRYAQR